MRSTMLSTKNEKEENSEFRLSLSSQTSCTRNPLIATDCTALHTPLYKHIPSVNLGSFVFSFWYNSSLYSICCPEQYRYWQPISYLIITLHVWVPSTLIHLIVDVPPSSYLVNPTEGWSTIPHGLFFEHLVLYFCMFWDSPHPRHLISQGSIHHITNVLLEICLI